MPRPTPRPILVLALLGSLLLVPAGASAATKLPTVSSVSPLKLGVGQNMTVRGKNFRSGANKNTVVFKRDGAQAVFVKVTGKATSRKLTVKIPAKLLAFLTVSEGKQEPTRFRLRVFSSRFGKRFTSLGDSPTISAVTVVEDAKPNDCDGDGTSDGSDANDDNDNLGDEREKALGTNQCSPDSDSDGVEDGFEYESALDLNSRALPYPGKRPYPNPLDADASIDYDGDSLTLSEEYALWIRFGDKSAYPVLNYSDGTQSTQPTSAAGTPAYQDIDGNGVLSDDERDGDRDGLTNYDETHGRATEGWWRGAYKDERPYLLRPFFVTNFLDPDSDGDTQVDGADDQDSDDFTNAQELSRALAGGLLTPQDPNGRVNPFNPCLPNADSRTCAKYLPFDNAPAPFDGSPSNPYVVNG